MRAQRRAGQIPKLTIDDHGFEIRESTAEPIRICPVNALEADGTAPEFIRLSVMNIGPGTATNVVANWTYDLDGLVSSIRRLDANHDIEFKIESFGEMGQLV